MNSNQPLNSNDPRSNNNNNKERIIHIEICRDCKHHSSSTWHDETKYKKMFLDVKSAIESTVPGCQVFEKRDRLINLGAFEIMHGEKILFSKKASRLWPNPKAVATRVQQYFEALEAGKDTSMFGAGPEKAYVPPKKKIDPFARSSAYSMYATATNTNAMTSQRGQATINSQNEKHKEEQETHKEDRNGHDENELTNDRQASPEHHELKEPASEHKDHIEAKKHHHEENGDYEEYQAEERNNQPDNTEATQKEEKTSTQNDEEQHNVKPDSHSNLDKVHTPQKSKDNIPTETEEKPNTEHNKSEKKLTHVESEKKQSHQELPTQEEPKETEQSKNRTPRDRYKENENDDHKEGEKQEAPGDGEEEYAEDF